MKNILIAIITILILVLAFIFLDRVDKKSINDCVNAGHSKNYCEYHLR